MDTTHVLIVNDSIVATQLLKKILSTDPAFGPIGWARDGLEAETYVRQSPPDVILMDIHMPHQNGIVTTRHLMDEYTLPILVVTATVKANMPYVFDCLRYGALDAISLPRHRKFKNLKDLPNEQIHELGKSFIQKVHTVTSLKFKLQTPKPEPEPQPSIVIEPQPRIPVSHTPAKSLIGIGASTGGPAAIYSILSQLSPAIPAAVVLLQHVDVEFIAGLKEYLSEGSQLPVQIAQEDEFPYPGHVYLPRKAGYHLIITKNKKFSYQKASVALHAPSIDVFFNSLVTAYQSQSTGILLTGMGADGAEGLLKIKQAGGKTIAQDQTTSSVYGMPKVAADMNAAQYILPLSQIPVFLKQHFSTQQ